MSLDDLKLRSKVLLPLALMAATLIAVVGFGAYELTGISESGHEISQRGAGVLELARASRALVYVPYSTFAALSYDNNSEGGKAAKDDFDHAGERIDQMFAAAASALSDERAQIEAFKARADALIEKTRPVFQRVYDLPGVDHGAELKRDELIAMAAGAKAIGEIDAEARKLTDELVAFNSRNRDANLAAGLVLEARSTQAIVALVAVGLILTLMAGGFGLWLAAAKIAGPLGRLALQMKALARGDLNVKIAGADRRDEIGDMAQAVEVFKTNAVERRRAEEAEKTHRGEVESERERSSGERAKITQAQSAAMEALCRGLEKLAEGDLNVRLDAGFSGDFVRVRDDFNAATQKLATTLGSVVQASQNIQSGAHEISSASDDLSQRTERQAANLEETAAAVEEITTTLKKSAEGARHAAEVVGSADKDAKEGAVVVKQAVEAMDAISKSSDQIGQIIGVIDEIAFQTNLLALNAGVEAARAGDAGKGFAVVASEVRGLAQRSAEAAKEIKSLISTSGLQVETGVQLVADTGRALERIIVQVSEINTVVAQIASGAQEQASGLQEVNTAISEMDQTTQQNATMVEQSTAASHSLSQEAQRLAGLVGQFRLDDGRGAQLRRELEKTAPHAFAKSAPAKPALAKPAPRPAVARPKAAAAGGSHASQDWNEF